MADAAGGEREERIVGQVVSGAEFGALGFGCRSKEVGVDAVVMAGFDVAAGAARDGLEVGSPGEATGDESTVEGKKRANDSAAERGGEGILAAGTTAGEVLERGDQNMSEDGDTVQAAGEAGVERAAEEFLREQDLEARGIAQQPSEGPGLIGGAAAGILTTRRAAPLSATRTSRPLPS